MVLLMKKIHLVPLLAFAVLVLSAAACLLARQGEDTSQALSWALAGRVIVVDAGHGGIDPGAIGPGGTLEKDVTLGVALKLRDMLERAGAVVVMPRETDTDLGTPGKSVSTRKREDLQRRIALARDSGAQVYLAVQANAFGTDWTGAQTFYNPKSDESKQLAEVIQAELIRILGNTNRKAKGLDVFVLRNLTIPTVIIEVGFLSNAREERLLADPAYQERLALGIYSGVVQYLGNRK